MRYPSAGATHALGAAMYIGGTTRNMDTQSEQCLPSWHWSKLRTENASFLRHWTLLLNEQDWLLQLLFSSTIWCDKSAFNFQLLREEAAKRRHTCISSPISAANIFCSIKQQCWVLTQDAAIWVSLGVHVHTHFRSPLGDLLNQHLRVLAVTTTLSNWCLACRGGHVFFLRKANDSAGECQSSSCISNPNPCLDQKTALAQSLTLCPKKRKRKPKIQWLEFKV